jgi:hypothetical protein
MIAVGMFITAERTPSGLVAMVSGYHAAAVQIETRLLL